MKTKFSIIFALLTLGFGLSFAKATTVTDSVFFGQSITIGITHNGNDNAYSWNTGDIGPHLTVTPVVNTTYIEQWTNPLDAVAYYDTIYVVMKDLPNTLTVDTIYSGQTITIGIAHTNLSIYSYMWNTGSMGIHIPVTPTTTTTYIERWENPVDAVWSYDTFKVVVKPQVNTLITSTSTTTICSGTTVSIGTPVNNALFYVWSNGAASAATIPVTPATTTTYTRIAYDTAGAVSKDTFNVIVNPTPTVFIASFAPSSTICAGMSDTLIGCSNIGPSIYHWISPIDTISGTRIVTPTTTTTYTVIGTSPQGCSDTATYTVTVNPKPSNVSLAVPANPICEGQSVSYGTAFSTNATSYLWSAPNGASITNGQGTGICTIVWTSLAGGQVSVAGVNFCGTGIATTFTIVVNPKPGNITMSIPITQPCEGQIVSYGTAFSTNATSYLWSTPNGATITNGQGTGICMINWGNSVGGMVSVSGMNACGTGQPMTFTVTVNPAPTLSISATPSAICTGQSALLTAITNGNTYQWNNGTTTASQPASPFNNGSVPVQVPYSVTVTGANGCTNNGNIFLTVNPKPTATLNLTPNHACMNEQFVHLAGGYPLGGIYQSSIPIVGDSLPYYWSGMFPISYIYTNQYGCSDTATAPFIWYDLPTVTFNPINTVYTNTPPFMLIAQPSGCVFSGPGVTGPAAGGVYYFDPALAGVGNHMITATYTDPNSGCSFPQIQYALVLSPTGIEEFGSQSFSIYPNPVRDIIFIKNAEKFQYVEIYNVLGGKELKTIFSSEINVSTLSAGTYIISLLHSNGVSIKKKFIKE